MILSTAPRLLRALIVLLACGCVPASLAHSGTSADPTPTPTPQSLASIPEDLEALQDLRRELSRQLADTTALEQHESALADLESAALPDLQRQAAELETDPRLVDLLDVDTAARNLNEELAARFETLDSEVRRAEKALEETSERRASWISLADAAAAAKAPDELRGLAEEAQRILAELAGLAQGRRDQALQLLDRTARLKTVTADLRDSLADRIFEVQKEMLSSASQPLWRIGLQSPRGVARAMRHSAGGDLRRVADYARTNRSQVILVFFVVLVAALIVSLLVRRRLLRTADAEQAPGLSPVMAHPVIASILLAVFAAKVMAPPGPQVISHLFWAVMAVPAALLAGSILGRSSVFPITLVTATVLLWPFRAYFEVVPLLDRILLLAEDAAGIAAVLMLLRRGVVTDRLSGGWRAAARFLLWAEAIVLSVSLVAGVFGELGLARLLRDGAVVSLGLAMVLFGTARALFRIVGDVLHGPVGESVRMVRTHPESSLEAVRRIIVFASLAAWAWLSLEAFQLTKTVQSGLQSVLGAGVEVGWFDLSVGEALGFFGAVAAAFVIARVICFVLDEELLPRLPLARGVPYMISTSVRYLILLAGFAFALAALGVDLSKATILAGAFGVGLGFGLQNVVNNFVSGLILLFERPIRVGDVVEVAGVRGGVSRIGIRSSTVSTAAGSEVIVPNGDLISKDVTNWTLTDRRRLVEVLVGVAYGCNPRTVKEVLERVACEHGEILDDPPPKAFFISFGDSQLDFRLVCWVADYGDGYRVASELRMAVAETFEQAGIEIPFPQQELRVRSGGDTTLPAVIGEHEEDSSSESRG